MEEIVKHINDTNASFRTIGAGNAKNTDLFLDNEHYDLFRNAGEQITVRLNKENLQKAILFIASILPRKYDNSATHKTEPFSTTFVYNQLALLDAFFTVDGAKVDIRTQTWNARKDVMKTNGEIDKRFYFNGLLEDVEYINYKGERISDKFTIRNYLAGNYSDIHIRKADDGIFDVWITNTLEPYNDGKEIPYEQDLMLIVNEKKLTSFILASIQFFNNLDKLNALLPYAGNNSPIKIYKENLFNLTGMFLEATPEELAQRNATHNRWFEEQFFLGEKKVYLSTQWNSQGDYQLTLADFTKMINLCYGSQYIIKRGPENEFQLWSNKSSNNHILSAVQPHIYGAFHKGQFSSYLTALRTKPFVLLAGISGTGKSRIVRKLAQATTTQQYEKEEDRWKDNRPENFELIQVKPNWHNSMDVVGFYSNISGKYEFTPFVEFIVKAWQHKDTPYFLCLDEMNLAPVEEYFAEFLSAIESRSSDENGEYITDPIIKPFKNYGEKEGKAMLIHLLGDADPIDKNPIAIHFFEKGLTLPPNLIVMGTVNMDETTFTFSRKVLDRAMSIEMNKVDYDKFLSGESEQVPLLTDVNELLVNCPQQASEVKDRIDSEKVINYLKDVNILLEGTPFKLGYRAANEAMLYVAASMDFAGNEFKLGTALDEFTLMKILSRIEGDDNRLAVDEQDERIKDIKGGILDKGEDRINLLNCLRAIVRKHIGSATATEQKINMMYRTLEREHFVSYWA